MTLATVSGYDVTAKNYSHRPLTGHPALYVTGTSDIIATPAMLHANPTAITINQSGAEVIADMYDVEARAITPAEVPGLIRLARIARAAGNGRRNPGAYVNQSNTTAVVNELVAANLTNVPLWIANYNLTETQAIAALQTSSGPFPVVGYQYHNAGTYDQDVWLSSWVGGVSAKGTQYGWRWCRLCQGLFYGPNVKTSRCPTGGLHVAANSYDYGLPYETHTTS